ncbi:hypothetical protein EVAR_96231_1 [Eumeta japonica]|uniref:Uncharacterized protein n=1 Tax=Eumeta variegata TaxID=151549 RepID=A0A4C1WNE1_EUMVA|nr:hypothetical protein EVAR_96231_1 [Eumeta japonica]
MNRGRNVPLPPGPRAAARRTNLSRRPDISKEHDDQTRAGQAAHVAHRPADHRDATAARREQKRLRLPTDCLRTGAGARRSRGQIHSLDMPEVRARKSRDRPASAARKSMNIRGMSPSKMPYDIRLWGQPK